jgi:chromosome partitioning protein
MTHIILFGNEKGGSGKTTTAMHLVVALLELGFKVATIDIDLRQASLTRYIENRKKTYENENTDLVMPDHYKVMKECDSNKSVEYTEDDNVELEGLIERLRAKYDFVIIDTPGNDNTLARHAHYLADTIVTPINDSFVDVDLLGKIDSNDYSKAIPGIYSAMVWEQKKYRALKRKDEIKWVVVRNRLSSHDVINKRNVGSAIVHLGKRLGFSISPGFGDRVVFKELFLNGMTLIDAKKNICKIKLNPSIVAARHELRDFIKSLSLSEVNKKL